MFCTLSDNYDPKDKLFTQANNVVRMMRSEVTHAIGSFLTAINGLTEICRLYIDTFSNTVVDIQQFIGKTSNG